VDWEEIGQEVAGGASENNVTQAALWLSGDDCDCFVKPGTAQGSGFQQQ